MQKAGTVAQTCNSTEKERGGWIPEGHRPDCPNCQVLGTMRGPVSKNQGGQLLKLMREEDIWPICVLPHAPSTRTHTKNVLIKGTNCKLPVVVCYHLFLQDAIFQDINLILTPQIITKQLLDRNLALCLLARDIFFVPGFPK